MVPRPWYKRRVRRGSMRNRGQGGPGVASTAAAMQLFALHRPSTFLLANEVSSRMHTIARALVASALGALLLAAAPSPTTDLRGYSTDAAKAERDWEAKLRAIPSPDSLREYMRRLSARPHHVGSPYDRDNAEWILAKFKSFGLDAHIETFDVLFPTPKERVVELVAPTKFVAQLREPPVAGDLTSAQQTEQLATYNAYSIDGDVTAPLVYVNYGVPADYEQLERMGISVKGAIVIARYFGSWRGIKPKVAAEHGAVGCIIYSDPREDGYAHGEVYPQGPWRPKDGVQRGSVMDMPLYPGDPLTPGIGATKDAKRLAVSEAPTITKIPVLPISYGDAQPLLAALRGRVAPAEARRPRHHLPPRSRARPRASAGQVRLESETPVRRDRAHPGRRRAGRVGDPRQSSRRLGERRGRPDLGTGAVAGRGARLRAAPQAGLEAAPHHHLRGLGRRGAGLARLDRVGRGPCRRAGRQGRRVPEQRHQQPRVPEHRRLPLAREFHQRRGTRYRRS